MKTSKIMIVIFSMLIVFGSFIFSCDSREKAKKMDYTLPMKDYKARMTASDPASWKPVPYKAVAPTEGVELSDKGLFKPAMEHNIHYLLHSFSNDHMLEPFRKRAKQPVIEDTLPQVPFWDTDLRGSNAGRFLMGAGNTLRWIENPDLRKQMNTLIDGIEACREPNGYILPFHPDGFPSHPNGFRSEEPNYARAWLVHGLLDAAIEGNPKAYELLRGHTDWFNRWNMLPQLLHYFNNSAQGHVPSTRTYLSPIGKPEDLQAVEKYYVCDWWMDGLEAEHEEAVWLYPLQNPHSYLITSFEAYLDHYSATGDESYLRAMKGAWNLIHDKWEHTGGSIAICEMHWLEDEQGRRPNPNEFPHLYPPYSYYITSAGTGEICGNVFWVKFNQRFHQLYPNEEKYMAEIEKSIYNMALTNWSKEGQIAMGGGMEGYKWFPKDCANSCCEGQSTRLLGSLPEYIYSLTPDGLYVNLYEPSSIQHKVNGQPLKLTQETHFPFDKQVRLNISASSPVKMKLHIRVPYWATAKMDILINGKKKATGNPGNYVALSRTWNDGDRIDFTLPAGLRITKYAGTDTIPGFDRYGAEYGPVLLSSVADSEDISEKFVDMSRLRPDTSLPLNFVTDGEHPNRLIPYFMVRGGQRFTSYPAAAKGSKFESHLVR
jgi:hypothetical protein